MKEKPLIRGPVPKIRPLKDIVLLYVDDSKESRKAKELLEKAGISPFVTTGSVEPYQRKPLVLFNGGTYQGLKEIRGLLRLLEFWGKMYPDWPVFKKEE